MHNQQHAMPDSDAHGRGQWSLLAHEVMPISSIWNKICLLSVLSCYALYQPYHVLFTHSWPTAQCMGFILLWIMLY